MQEPQLHELQSIAWLNPSIPGSLLLHVVEDLAAQLNTLLCHTPV